MSASEIRRGEMLEYSIQGMGDGSYQVWVELEKVVFTGPNAAVRASMYLEFMNGKYCQLCGTAKAHAKAQGGALLCVRCYDAQNQALMFANIVKGWDPTVLVDGSLIEGSGEDLGICDSVTGCSDKATTDHPDYGRLCLGHLTELLCISRRFNAAPA